MENTKPLRIIAIYKTFRGREFALDSLNSIYSQVRRIIYVHSDIGWNGERGNTVRDVVKAAPDPENKITHIDFDGKQNEQYRAAVEWIIKNEEHLYEYLQLIDTDEVWEPEGWAKAKIALRDNLEALEPVMSLRSGLYDYIKSPFYRIDPPAPLKPTVFVHAAAVKLFDINCRGDSIGLSKVMNDVWFHHFCSVRESLSAVWAKHEASCSIESQPIVNRDFWVKHIWNQLPFARDVLPLAKYKDSWRGVRVINKYDLPPAVLNNPLVKAWETYPTFSYSTHHTAMAQALKKAGLPEDFGPGHKDWNIPSKMNRYNMAMEAITNG